MRVEDIHVGDVVRIRDWDDMAQEFGVIESGTHIRTRPVFLEDMKYLCGQEVMVVEIRSPHDIIIDYERTEGCFLGADIFEPAQLELEPFNNDEIDVLLGI